ncbi:hypothetical protein L6R29_25855, partial [Myxococcota bacterium]|nr:hypothetical protein [Myxococcota bacterium]
GKDDLSCKQRAAWKPKTSLTPTFTPSPVHGGGLGWGADKRLTRRVWGETPRPTRDCRPLTPKVANRPQVFQHNDSVA